MFVHRSSVMKIWRFSERLQRFVHSPQFFLLFHTNALTLFGLVCSLFFVKFFGLYFSTLHEAQTTTTFLSLARFHFLPYSPPFLFSGWFLCAGFVFVVFCRLCFFSFCFCAFLTFLSFYQVFLCSALLRFFSLRFLPHLVPPLYLPISFCTLLHPFVCSPFCPTPPPCSHLLLLLCILDPPCLSSFRVSVFFPGW